MRKTFSTLVFLVLIVGACTPVVPASTTEAPIPVPTTPVPPPIQTVETAIQPIPQNCGYQWAQQDLPELSSSFQQSIQVLQPEAQASAYAFGENCVLADGTIAGFSAMETDFNITLHVDDLANEAVLGRWIVQVMEVIQNIPPEQISGPRPGRVSIVFQSSTAQQIINFYIDQYQALPSGLSHTEIYEALLNPQ